MRIFQKVDMYIMPMAGKLYCINKKSVPVAAQSKVSFCARLPAEIVGSNPVVDTDVFLL